MSNINIDTPDENTPVIIEEPAFWHDFEYLDGLPGKYAVTFDHRKVVDFSSDTLIANIKTTAYALRIARWGNPDDHIQFNKLFSDLIENPNVNQIEALIFGWCGCGSVEEIPNLLTNNKHHFPDLKAIFLGDIEDSEMMISDVRHPDLGMFLSVYPKLHTLYVRGGGRNFYRYFEGLRFSLYRHESLKVIRIESGGINHETIKDLNEIDLPNLEYLELWLGKNEYGGNSTIEDLIPIVSGSKFPNLKYLGLRNCEYTDDIAFELAKSPLMESLTELDLSMGTLGLDGLLALANSPAINRLKKMNVSQNFIPAYPENSQGREDFIKSHPEIANAKCELIIGKQRSAIENQRYCVVGFYQF
jgi:hypothetical protein